MKHGSRLMLIILWLLLYCPKIQATNNTEILGKLRDFSITECDEIKGNCANKKAGNFDNSNETG